MPISKLSVATRNILRKFGFNFPPSQGDNALATIKDVNYIIDSLNNIAPYRSFDFSINQVGILDPVVTKLAVGASECPNNCGSICSACDCRSTCQNEGSSIFNMAVARTGVGVYTLTFSGSQFAGAAIQNVGLFFTPFPAVTTNITVVKTSATVYTLHTFAGAVATDGLLVNTVVAARVYYQ